MFTKDACSKPKNRPLLKYRLYHLKFQIPTAWGLKNLVSGQCIENGNDFECICDANWSGEICDTFVPPSPCESQPCAQGDFLFKTIFEYQI